MTKHHTVIIIHLFHIKFQQIKYLRDCKSHSVANVKHNMLSILAHETINIIQIILMAPTWMKDSQSHPLKYMYP